MPRLGMSCSLVQHKLSPFLASHVVSKLRQVTCATRMAKSFVIKNLDKINHDCNILFPRDSQRIDHPKHGLDFRRPGFVTPTVPQHQFSGYRVLNKLVSGRNNWMRVALTPTSLPRRHSSHGSQYPIQHILPIESAAEV